MVKTGKGDDITFLKFSFLAFIIAVRKNKEHFLNAGTKLDKIVMFSEEVFCWKFDLFHLV